jgi:hypothetical protein
VIKNFGGHALLALQHRVFDSYSFDHGTDAAEVDRLRGDVERLKASIVWLRDHLASGNKKNRKQILKATDAFVERIGRPQPKQIAAFSLEMLMWIEKDRFDD